MPKISFFSTKTYDVKSFSFIENIDNYTIKYHNFLLSAETVKLAFGSHIVCCFVNDDLSREILKQLAVHGTKLIAMRCAGHDKVDLKAAKEFNIQVVNVPAYSPEAVAEHAVGMMMSLNRHFHKAYQRTRDANFNLDGLVGFNFYGKTAGVIGTGKIGLALIKILHGLGMNILCHDPYPNNQALKYGARYVSLSQLYKKADIISLHCPMSAENHYLLDANAFSQMKDNVMIINTSRGQLLDSSAAVAALKSGKIGALGLDVYEHERDLFFEDKSNDVIVDDIFRILSASHNVLFTGHQAFLTTEALDNIAHTTMDNIQDFIAHKKSGNELIVL